MDKVRSAFNGKKANIGYIVAGYPSLEKTKEFLENLDESTLDLLEIGIPYSDPLADGKLIAQASFETVQNGVNTDVVFDMLESCKAKVTKPLVFLVYFNISSALPPEVTLTSGTRHKFSSLHFRANSSHSSQGRSGTIKPLTPASRDLFRNLSTP